MDGICSDLELTSNNTKLLRKRRKEDIIMYNGDKEKNLVKHITDNLNTGVSNKTFCEAMSREHRALQYDFTNLCIWWLEKCRDMYEQGNYDGRNEHACKAGKMLMDFYDGK